MYDLNEVTDSNDEYIYKSSDRVIQLFNNTWRRRYLRPRKVMFDDGYDFKQGLTTLLKHFYIKTVLTTIKTTS